MAKMKETARKNAIEVLEQNIIAAAYHYSIIGGYIMTLPTIGDDKMTFDVFEPSSNMDYVITVNLKTGDYWDSEDLYDTDYTIQIRKALQYFHDEYDESSVPDNFE